MCKLHTCMWILQWIQNWGTRNAVGTGPLRVRKRVFPQHFRIFTCETQIWGLMTEFSFGGKREAVGPWIHQGRGSYAVKV